MIHTFIRNRVENPDDYLVGFADLKGLLPDAPFKSGIVIGRRLDAEVMDSIELGPTRQYLDYYHKINAELSELILEIKTHLANQGYDSEVVEPTLNKKEAEDAEYLRTLRTPVSHKMLATRAGLGWIGKTDLFVSKKFGPRVRLVSLLTNYPVDITEKPIDKSRCGKCAVCVVKCPAGAASGQLWDIYTDRDEYYDARKCREMCRKLSENLGDADAEICGICVSVCPVGKKPAARGGKK